MSLCKSCGAEIVWAITAANGKPIPVDAQPAAGGNVRLVRDHAGTLHSQVAGSTIDLTDPTDDGTRHMPHHATCPHANEWRKDPKGAAR